MLMALLLNAIVTVSSLDATVYKALHRYYGETVLLSEHQRELPNGNLYSLEGKSDIVYVGKANSRFEHFDFMVIFKGRAITHIKVLRYRENYGAEVCSKRYLRANYVGIRDPVPFVDAISGATISVNALHREVNTLFTYINN